MKSQIEHIILELKISANSIGDIKTTAKVKEIKLAKGEKEVSIFIENFILDNFPIKDYGRLLK